MKTNVFKKQNGFTFIELMGVLAVIAVAIIAGGYGYKAVSDSNAVTTESRVTGAAFQKLAGWLATSQDSSALDTTLAISVYYQKEQLRQDGSIKNAFNGTTTFGPAQVQTPNDAMFKNDTNLSKAQCSAYAKQLANVDIITINGQAVKAANEVINDDSVKSNCADTPNEVEAIKSVK